MIRLDFAGSEMAIRAELDDDVLTQLAANARRLGVQCTHQDHVAHCFAQLIELATAKHGQRVAVLIDEYDKSILNNLSTPDVAREMRERPKNTYSVLETKVRRRIMVLQGDGAGSQDHFRGWFCCSVSARVYGCPSKVSRRRNGGRNKERQEVVRFREAAFLTDARVQARLAEQRIVL